VNAVPRIRNAWRFAGWLQALGLVAILASPRAALAQFAAQGPSAQAPSETVRRAEADWATAPVEEQQAVSHHNVATPSGVIGYTARAGTITIRDINGKPTASVFYVAYTADAKASATRPITFVYNGGPGAATIWLHMGSFGPVRVATDAPERVSPAPHDPLGPNPDTLLDKTDLVFIDAVSTGYSRPLGDVPAKQFWSVDADADAFARTVIGFIGETHRWSSPKFLLGESYGTARSAILAKLLQERGVAVNGVVLLSSFLNLGLYQSGYDRDAIGFLPTYAAIAWYHHRVADPAPDLATAAQRARDFAEGPYALALARGSQLDAATREQVARRMAELTGLSEPFILNSNLRVDPTAFRKELLRGEGLTLGHADARYLGVDATSSGMAPDSDPSHTAIYDSYASSLQSYLADTLGYRTKLPYLVAAYAFSDFRWDNSHIGPDGSPQAVANSTVDLASAMRADPYLQVLSLNGYYDLSTPFANTEYDLRHMALRPAQARNITAKFYPAGHMLYLNPDVRRRMHADIGDFIDQAVATAAAGQLTTTEMAQ
jgi:carboxypeptidase C (cathepsin A)